MVSTEEYNVSYGPAEGFIKYYCDSYEMDDVYDFDFYVLD